METPPPNYATKIYSWFTKCNEAKDIIRKNNEILLKFPNVSPNVKNNLECEINKFKNDIINYKCEWPKNKRELPKNKRVQFKKNKLLPIQESNEDDNNNNMAGGKRRQKRRSAKINRRKRHTQTRKSKNRWTTRKK